MHPYISDIVPCSTAAQFPHWQTSLIGAIILSVNGVPTTSKKDVDAALSSALVTASGNHDYKVDIVFAIDKNYHRDALHSMTNSALQADQICHVASIVEPCLASTSTPIHDVLDTGE
jgi:hypothetical protein